MVIITLNSYKKLQVKRFWLTCWRVRASVGGNSGYGLSLVANPCGTGAQQCASPTSQRGRQPGIWLRKEDARLEKRWNKKGIACLGIFPEWLPPVKLWCPGRIGKPFSTQCTSVVIPYLSLPSTKFSWAAAAMLRWSTFAANVCNCKKSTDSL